MLKDDITIEELKALYTKQEKRLNTIIKQSDKQTKQLLDLNDKLLDAANTDPMTGAYNRRYFFETAKKIISTSTKEGTTFYIAMLDIDKFKNINDTYGHDIGDVIIKDLTIQMNKTLRDSDTFARFGGEEFMAILTDTDEKTALEICENMRVTIEASVPVDNIVYTVSTGVSMFKCGEIIDDTIKRADEGLYVAKESGRNRVILQ